MQKENKNVVNKKLKMLFTIVSRNKADYYMDLIQSFESNMQVVLMGNGTASQDILDSLGIKSNEKSVIVSVVREDRINDLLDKIGDKFKSIKGGKGIAFTIPMTSVIGVTLFKFLSNYGREATN